MDRHAVVIPTYNECDNIGSLVGEIAGLGIGTRIIIVDDNSPDGTGQLADQLGREYEGIEVIHRPGKLGLGTAHIAGMKAALAGGAIHILTMDADFSHRPRYVPSLLSKLSEYDLVIGSRYVRGGGTVGCTPPRRALSRGANLLAHVVLGLSATDATAGFRGYHRKVLETLALDSILSDGYSFLIEILYRCQRQGWRIGEVPIVFENRQRGASKISRTEVWKALHTVLRLESERLGFRRSPAQRAEKG